MDECVAQTGGFIISQGETGNHFYVLEVGECSVIVDGGVMPYTITAGNAFGELVSNAVGWKGFSNMFVT